MPSKSPRGQARSASRPPCGTVTKVTLMALLSLPSSCQRRRRTSPSTASRSPRSTASRSAPAGRGSRNRSMPHPASRPVSADPIGQPAPDAGGASASSARPVTVPPAVGTSSRLSRCRGEGGGMAIGPKPGSSSRSGSGGAPPTSSVTTWTPWSRKTCWNPGSSARTLTGTASSTSGARPFAAVTTATRYRPHSKPVPELPRHPWRFGTMPTSTCTVVIRDLRPCRGSTWPRTGMVSRARSGRVTASGKPSPRQGTRSSPTTRPKRTGGVTGGRHPGPVIHSSAPSAAVGTSAAADSGGQSSSAAVHSVPPPGSSCRTSTAPPARTRSTTCRAVSTTSSPIRYPLPDLPSSGFQISMTVPGPSPVPPLTRPFALGPVFKVASSARRAGPGASGACDRKAEGGERSGLR
jgi:hypothetical protein